RLSIFPVIEMQEAGILEVLWVVQTFLSRIDSIFMLRAPRVIGCYENRCMVVYSTHPDHL
ncbi:hypothetical protein, partial [Xanthomonas oryzae]|uniref:hypothetical protein n=1 Tax=Xanthomonas oryzae TaxID=347 RepID=UPI001C67BFAD